MLDRRPRPPTLEMPNAPSLRGQESRGEITPSGNKVFQLGSPRNKSNPPQLTPPPSLGQTKKGSRVCIDIPSPGSWDPQLEHFLRPLEAGDGACQCIMVRYKGGKHFDLMLEEGNVLLLSAKRKGKEFCLSLPDSTPLAHLQRPSRRAFVLQADSKHNGPSGIEPELSRFLLDELTLNNVPSEPQINTVTMTMGQSPVIATGNIYTSLARPGAELETALHAKPNAVASSITRLHSRRPLWNDQKELLTLDYPPGRAIEASVQNFQLCDETEEPSVVLVHGLIREEDNEEHFSLDFCSPLSTLQAFAAALAVQEWG